MPRKRYKPEEIVAKLRQVDVLVSPGCYQWHLKSPRLRAGRCGSRRCWRHSAPTMALIA
jgi:hypothetical protein